jgi:hypothetical protein
MAPPNLVDFPEMLEMSISKATFAPSTPCTIHFEFLENGPNDSTRVCRLTGILRRARVKIFILANGSHESKIAKRIWSRRSKYSNFYSKPRLLMTNEAVLDRFRWARAVKLQPIWSCRYERRLIFQNEYLKTRPRATFQFSVTLGENSFTSVRLQDENSGATDSGRPLLPLWPISCLCT